MSKLYKELAEVYEAMYQTFIDYKEEYDFYSGLLEKYNKNQVLEIGCGTGHLANYFAKNGFEYIGMDLSEEMIQLAKNKAHTSQFIKGDMRDFKINSPLQSVIITARTISYLSSNKDVKATFSSIFNNLQSEGILCFDFIDANAFIPLMAKKKEVVHEATFRNIHYIRKSKWDLNLKHGMDFNWNAVYYKKDGDHLIEIGQDQSIIRTFTINEIEVFLFINGFKIKEIIERASYFFPTYVVVAERVN